MLLTIHGMTCIIVIIFYLGKRSPQRIPMISIPLKPRISFCLDMFIGFKI